MTHIKLKRVIEFHVIMQRKIGLIVIILFGSPCIINIKLWKHYTHLSACKLILSQGQTLKYCMLNKQMEKNNFAITSILGIEG